MITHQQKSIDSRVNWRDLNATANKVVVTYMTYLLLFGSALSFVMQFFFIRQTFAQSIILAMVLIAFGIWFNVIGRLSMGVTLKTHLISASLFVLIPLLVLSYREFVETTIWALPMMFIIPTVIYASHIMIGYLMISTILTQIFLWVYPGYASAAITIYDYLFRIGLIAITFAMTMIVNVIYVRKIRKSIEHTFYDSLTGLPNRALFYERLSQTVARCNQHNHKAALLIMDLDGFKTVNDTLGHAIGDKILVEIASRIQQKVQPGDSVSRIGGDEFTIVFEELTSIDEMIRMAERLLEALSASMFIDDHQISLGVSMGIVSIPEDDVTVEGIVRKADAAMYLSKSKGKGCYSFHSHEVDIENQKKMRMIPKLKNALMHNEFQLYFQPQVKSDEKGMRIVGLEALIRWEHPVEGTIHPSDFIACAQDTGMIIPIGKWVIHEACKTVKFFEMLGIDLPISVNASVLQFHSDTFIAETTAAIEETGIHADKLHIEITENIFIDSTGIQTLNRLKTLGVKIALDDFGTGYSSLSILRSLPIDFLKIDRTFVMNLHRKEDREITSVIISMAQILGIDVISEGVETQEQLKFLSDIGCSLFQGFLFGRPMQLSSLLDLFFKTRLAI